MPKSASKSNTKQAVQRQQPVNNASYEFSAELLKKLVNNEETVRNEGLERAKNILQSRKNKIEFLELQKLWKALWFHMWHSDMPLVQQSLARELAELVPNVDSKNRDLFIEAFWSICVREFEILDRYRINKFYMLTRFFLNAVITDILSSSIKTGSTKNENGKRSKNGAVKVELSRITTYSKYMTSTGPLSFSNNKYPHNLRLHLIDIYVDECEKVFTELKLNLEDMDLENENAEVRQLLLELFNPVVKQAESSEFEHIKARANEEVLLDERLVSWSVVSPKTNESEQPSSSDEEHSTDAEEISDDEQPQSPGKLPQQQADTPLKQQQAKRSKNKQPKQPKKHKTEIPFYNFD